MFKRKEDVPSINLDEQADRVSSVLGSDIIFNGNMSGKGGVRIEGAFEGDISLNGKLIVGEKGRVTCSQLTANVVIVAGAIKGNITTERIQIRKTGRVWGNVNTVAFTTEEGAFIRGLVQMEESIDLEFQPDQNNKNGAEEEN